MKAIPAALVIAAFLGTPRGRSKSKAVRRMHGAGAEARIKPITGIAKHPTPIRILAAAAIVGLLGAASAPALSEDRAEAIDATEARDFPQAIFDRIAAKITAQTTFQQLGPEGVLRWWPRTIKLVEFVKAPSPTYPDTHLYAMRYAVSVLSERDSFAIYQTSCQVVVVQRNETYSEPTVACAPVNLDQESDAS